MDNAQPDAADGVIDQIDLEALGQVRAVYDRLDPVPPGLAERTKFAITMHALEAEVAELIQPELALTRRDEVARAESVTFTSSSLNVMVTIAVLGTDDARVDGWTTVPGATVRLHLDDEDGADDRTEIADESGRFAFSRVPRGSARLVVTPPQQGARPVLTPAFEV